MNDQFERKPALKSAALIAAAAGAAAIVAVVFVLPAEYGIDPTGAGRMLGFDALSQPAEVTVETRMTAPPDIVRLEPDGFASDTVTIEVPPFSQNYGQIEYKVSMAAGAALVFNWRSDRPVIYEMHGHTVDARDGTPIEVMDYVAGEGTSMAGQLIAPIAGIHGWYFANSELDDPATITIELAGYYRLEPGIMVLGR